MSDIRNYFKKVSNTNKRNRDQTDDHHEEKSVSKTPTRKKSVEKVASTSASSSVVRPKQVKTTTEIVSPTKKMKITEDIPVEKKKRAQMYKAFMNRSGPSAPGSKEIPDGQDNCLHDLTFVISGVLESLERDECKELIEKYGGRVTTTISKKTNYLIAGSDVGESKSSKARELKIDIISEDDLLEMIRTRSGTATAEIPSTSTKTKRKSSTTAKTTDSPELIVVTPSSSSKLKRKSTEPSVIPKPSTDDSNLLWVDKYKPKTVQDLIGQQGDKSCVQKLIVWLRDWYQNHSHSDEKVKAKPSFGFNRNENPAMFKAALLSGPPGIGKTSAAQIVCQYLNYDYIEKNASDQRSKKSMSNLLSDTYSIEHFTSHSMTKHVLIMDEVDGVSGNNDRGGIQELIGLIKRSRIPIICICNDRQHEKIRSLANYCYDLRFYRPTIPQIRGLMQKILQQENIHYIKQEILDEIIQSCNQDIRQTIHSLNLWTIRGTQQESSIGAKMIDKSTNQNPFELCRLSFAEEFRKKSLSDKSDIFFYDYQLMPLLVQENYLHCQPQLHSKKLTDTEHLNLIAKAADSISLGDVCSQMIFSKNESWSLLPYQAIYSTVAPCSYVRGHLRGMVSFSSFFGQRSRTNKNQRLFNEIEKHICLKTSSANKQQFNLDYLPYFSRLLISPLEKSSSNIPQCISLLNDYYLNRDDFQTMMELNTWGKTGRNLYEQLDTQTKTALTRNYNKSTHRMPYATIDIKKLKKMKESDDEEEEEENENLETINDDAMIKPTAHTSTSKKSLSTSDTLKSQSSSSSPQTFMKRTSLVFLTLQNVTSILLLRYVRTTPGPRFMNSTLVVNSEIQKTIISIICLIFEQGGVTGAIKTIYDKVIRNSKDTIKTGVPALLYTVQNNFLLHAISHLDAATFQVTFQLKIFTTAIFTIMMLPRQLNLVQWFALFLLFFGVSLVQVENMTATTQKPDVDAALGLLYVISACVLSGLAGVYFERILKTSDVSIWIRNIQLGLFSTVFGLIAMHLNDGEQVQSKGFLFGYTNYVWLAVTIQSAGGILVALVIKYADNITKGFATSLAIILACIVSIILFDFELTILFSLGALLVICSIFLYSKPDLIVHVPLINLVFRDKSVLL